MPKRLLVMLLVTAINVAVVLVVLANVGGRGGDGGSTPGPSGDHITLASAALAAKPGAAPAAEQEDLFKTRVQPFLAKYCLNCHGEKTQKADLALHGFDSKLSVLRGRKTWLSVSKMIHEGEMPSGKGPKPTMEEREWIVKWIDQTLNDIDCENRDPGRVTIRRLNRVEYNNTVRDLMGVNFTPADDFPTDDVGYGFDNIGDVLSMPPVLLEKYLKAAEQVVTAALANDPGRKGNEVRYIEASSLKGGSDDRRTKIMVSEGDIYTEIDFPRDGKYEFRVRAYGHQAGPDPVKMALMVDKDTLHTFEVKAAERSEDYNHTATIKRGRQRVAMRFLNDFYDDKEKDPKRRDRNLLIRALTVIGPIMDKPEITSGSQIYTRFPNPDGSDWREVATEILTRKARQAYRRPVTKEEVAKLVNLVEIVKNDGGSFDQGLGLALQAMLVSPHFLFRIELDPDPLNPEAIRQLNDHELATRLSYFLWSSMPDEELSALADKGMLRQPGVLERQIKEMMQDPKATAMVKSFAGQWLQLRSLERITPDRKNFPEFDQELRQSMLRETELFFETIVKEDRSVLEFIDGRFTFVNGRLARHYGINGDFKGDGFRRVELDGVQRSGILTHASILTITSNPTRTSPVLRGKYVLEEILGTPPPPAPPDVPELPEGDKGELVGSLRQRMEQHRVNPVCASCHQKMDPIGFGLENYDGIGKWRTQDGPHPIDPTGVMPSGESFKTPAELKKMLLDRKNDFARTLAEKMLTFALGRGLEYYDKCAVDDIVAAMQKNDYRFSSMVTAIVQSDPFTKRRGKRADEP